VINWNIAGGFTEFLTLKNLIDALDESEVLANHKFSVFDAPYNTIWQGGRLFSLDKKTFEDQMKVINFYNNNNFGFNFVFTNNLLTEDHLKDLLCLKFLDSCYNKLNGVIVNNDLLGKFIRQNYPQYKLILSMTSNKNSVDDINFYKSAIDYYDLVVICPELNLNFDFLSQLNLDKIEILVNELCFPYCPYKIEHYTKISQCNLNRDITEKEYVNKFCHIKHGDKENPQNLRLNPEQIKQLIDFGVKNFKIAGRGNGNHFVKQELTANLFPILNVNFKI
jgi:collagenase-like PrtC family protease